MKYKVIARMVYEQEFIIEGKPFPPMPELGTFLTDEMLESKKEADRIARGIMYRVDLEGINPVRSSLEDYENVEIISMDTGELVYCE